MMNFEKDVLLPTLKLRRMRTMTLQVFSIVHKDSPLYLHNLINIEQHSYSFRYQKHCSAPQGKNIYLRYQVFAAKLIVE